MALAARLGCTYSGHNRLPYVLNNFLHQILNKSHPGTRTFQSRWICQIPKSRTVIYGYVLQSKLRVDGRLNCVFSARCPLYCTVVRRFLSSKSKMATEKEERGKYIAFYISAAAVFMLGMSFAAVPLYRRFCQVTGQGGRAIAGHDTEKIEMLEKVEDRVIKVHFHADRNAKLRWKFTPQQAFINVALGETALAFYTAENPTDDPIIGVSTYTVIPVEAGVYFNKIQCFCFEEQLLKPHEKVDLPVFFYIDPEMHEDPVLADCDNVVLAYTFFQAKPGLHLPLPGFKPYQSVKKLSPTPS